MLTQDNIAEAVAKGTPTRLIPTLLTKLDLTCLQHPHKAWLERNAAAKTDDLHNDTIQRHRQGAPHTPPKLVNIDDTERRQTVEWER